MPTPDDGRRAGLAARVEHAVDHEGLDRIHAFRRDRHAQPGVVLRAASPWAPSRSASVSRVVAEIEVDHREPRPAGGVLVGARDRVHHRGAQRILARGALAAAADRLLELGAVDLDAAPDASRCRSGCPVSWHSRLSVSSATLMLVIIVPSTALRRGVGLAPRERARSPRLMSGGSMLQRADVELLAPTSSTRLGSTFICRPCRSRHRVHRGTSDALNGPGEDQPGDSAKPGRDRGERLLPFAPRQELEREQPQPAGEVRAEQDHQAPLRRDHERLLGPAQEGVEGRLAAQRGAQSEEMRGQEEGEGDARDAMHHERPPSGVVARAVHGRLTAATARSPTAASASATPSAEASAACPRQPSHSPATVRRPIAPWIAQASTKTV